MASSLRALSGPALRGQLDALVARPWPVWGAALLVATINVFLFAFDRPYTASDGLRNWGDWILTAAGALRRSDLLPPWLYSGSLIDIGVLLGAAAAALVSGEFAIRVPGRGELLKGAIGGAFMGAGAALAFGCNIGGFFSAISALSLSGWGMMVGLVAGAFVGLRYLLWETAHRPHWSRGRGRVLDAAASGRSKGRRWLGALLIVSFVAAPFVWSAAGYQTRGLYLLFGAAFGVVFQRSRFCLVRAFREPFMTGDAQHTRAAAFAIVVSTLGFAVLKFADLKDRGDWVFAAAGVGSLGGGLLFGVGMTLAGGCGAGSIWRAGEGQVKLWAALATFALTVSLTRLALAATGTLDDLGAAVFLPAAVGWGVAVLGTVAVMAAWAFAATWNEDARKFTALD